MLLLNNDTIVTDGWLEGMVRCAERDVHIGIVGPMTNYITGPQLDPQATYTSIEQMHRYARRFTLRNRGRWMDFPRITGFCMLIKREVIQQVGILDERFGIGNFDDDYGLRAHLAGFRTVIAKDVFIHHFGSRTFLDSSIDYAGLLERNRVLFIEKWHVAPERWGALMSASPNIRSSPKPIGIQSDYSAAVFALGVRLLKSGRALEAAGQFHTLLQMRPDFPQVWEYLHQCMSGDDLYRRNCSASNRLLREKYHIAYTHEATFATGGGVSFFAPFLYFPLDKFARFWHVSFRLHAI